MYHIRAVKTNSTLRSFQNFIQNNGIKTMQSWQISKYGSVDELQLNTLAQIPVLKSPSDILVKVHAASVNPLDVKMLSGYGSTVLNSVRQVSSCQFAVIDKFPLVLGRDFSGTVVNVGHCVKDIKCGDEVWGATGAWQNGSHSEYLIAPVCNVSKKPTSLDHIEAASLPYAALTAWSALRCFGQLYEELAYKKRVLVTGATGGVGTFAVQVLRAWGAEVTATCSTDAVEMVLNLGADKVLDYTDPDFKRQLKDMKGFDLILDNVGQDYPSLTMELLKTWRGAKYISLLSPLLKNPDKYGLIFGTLKTSVQAAMDTVMSIKDGASFRWAYFTPNGKALQKIGKMVDNKQIVPVIHEIFKFTELPEAYEMVLNGHARGKVVIDFMTETGPHVEKDKTEKGG